MPTKVAVFDAPKRTAPVADGERRPLGGVALKIAAVAAGYGEKGIGKKLLATLVGATMGGTFSARFSEAKTAGAIQVEGSTVRTTPEGWATYAGSFQVPSTTDEVLALWRPRLGGVAVHIFDHWSACAAKRSARRAGRSRRRDDGRNIQRAAE